MKRGEIRWYKFSSPDKKRPVVILTRDPILKYLNEVTVAPVTTVLRDIPSEVLLTKADGLPRDCVVNCDYLQTISKNKIGSMITTLPPHKLAEVSQAITFALNL